MARQKLKRAAEIRTFANVFEYPVNIRGHWQRDVFKNENPIVLEIGCGEGAYTLELARRFSDKNFIGIDNKPERIWRGAKNALDQKLPNVIFLRVLIQFITDYFAEKEIAEIWITFPDPYPKNRQIKHRLISPHFLQSYRQILTNDGLIHLKTDVDYLFDYAVALIEAENGIIYEKIEDLYHSGIDNELLAIQTTYERKYLGQGRTIKYICFSLKKM